jgi:fructose-specific phosphotransferase system IIC component
MSKNKQAGLAKLIVLIVVVVLILSYLGINIQRIAESDAGKANFGYVWQICQQIGGWFVDLYTKYLAGYLNPVTKYLPFNVAK